jgi:hypothetical protein
MAISTVNNKSMSPLAVKLRADAARARAFNSGMG